MTIDFVPHLGPHLLIGVGGENVTIHLGDRELTIDPESAIELGRVLIRAAKFQQFRREREQLNLARVHRRR